MPPASLTTASSNVLSSCRRLTTKVPGNISVSLSKDSDMTRGIISWSQIGFRTTMSRSSSMAPPTVPAAAIRSSNEASDSRSESG